MVISRIKDFFVGVKKDTVFGDLYSNKNVVMSECEIQPTKEELVFSTARKRLIFNFKEISSLEHRNKSLMLTHKHQKYVFVSPFDLAAIYNEVHPLIQGCKCLYNRLAKYAVYRTSTGSFEEVEGEASVKIVKDDVFYLKIETEDEVVHFEEISSSTQYYMDQKNTTFVWSVLKDGLFYTFSLRFGESLTFLEFLSKYVSCLYKNVNDAEKEDEENVKYFERMEMENYSRIDDEPEDEREEYESCEDDELENPFGEADEKNKHLVVGDEMAFVTRGNSVGVFENTKDGLEFRAHIKDALEDGVEKIIAHDRCRSLIYLNRNQRDKLSKLDVERGEVVETWDIKRNINDYFDSQKLVNDGTLVGLSDYSVFRIDPRTEEKVVESKDYKTKNEFSCGMTTGRGHVAVASRRGDLRLYDSISKRAKSLLPGFGDKIKHIDVTSNGKHIICTCKNYLMLTTVPGDYRQPVGKEKPVPKRLQLKPEHLAYINEEVDFTPAKFSTDAAEDSIVTSTGHYVIKWNLRDVLSGRLYDYRITRCSDLVVVDNFEFGDDDNIIVTMPDDVRKVSARSLRRPNRRMWS
jgi:hypothetical protein